MKKKNYINCIKGLVFETRKYVRLAFQLDVKNYTHIRMKLSDIYKELAISKGRNLA